jgi:hypothetical protein
MRDRARLPRSASRGSRGVNGFALCLGAIHPHMSSLWRGRIQEGEYEAIDDAWRH